jgi:tRNA (guanine-N7-)-methyltransferase
MTNTTKQSKNSEGSAPYHKARSLFGRRQGRALGEERQNALNTILPKIVISQDHLTEDHSCHPQELFPTPHLSYWLEIGFGQGEHVAALAEINPQTGYLAAEPYVNGMAAFLKKIEDKPTDNIRAIMDDGMIIARSLTQSSLDGIYILNPDPWHKTRHHKRRIINQTNLDIFARILKPDGQLIMTSDVENLSNWMHEHACNHPEFEWQAKSIDECLTPPDDWIPTRYEQKGAKGSKKMVYLFFKRK